MRTTLDIDDDILIAAKELARQQGCTLGSLLSSLARRALLGDAQSPSAVREPKAVYGFQPFPAKGQPAKGQIVTNEHINELRDREGV